MFGWRDYWEVGKQWVENGVENSVFHCLGSEGKKRGRKTRENFPPGPTNFFPPKLRGKLWRENVLTVQLLDCPLLTSTSSSTAHSYQTQKINRHPYSSNPYKNSSNPYTIHINNQSEIEKRRRRRRRCQNHHFLHQKFLFSPPKITALNQTQPKIIIYNKSIKLKL